MAHHIHQAGKRLGLGLIQVLQYDGTLLSKFQHALHGTAILFHPKQQPACILAGKGSKIDAHIGAVFPEAAL